MEVIPAVDLMEGRVVRLSRGDPETQKTYEHFGHPLAVARRWEREGADALHIIDLDAALDRGSNLKVVEKIVRGVTIPVQVGGGIRRLKLAQQILRMGADRIILGTLAFKEQSYLEKLLESFGHECVVVALDHRGGEVMVRGWRTPTKLTVEGAMMGFQRQGVTHFLITSITRDGTLTGPDYDTLTRACGYPGVRVIAAGGVGALEDLDVLRRIGVWGVVIGKALYEGVFGLREALEMARGRCG